MRLCIMTIAAFILSSLISTKGKAAESEKPVLATYFVEWGVYDRNFHVNMIPAEKLTHVLYAFLAICGKNETLLHENPSGHAILQNECQGKPDYSVSLYDRYAALEKSYPGDSWDDPIRGNFGQLIQLKKKYPHLKVLPSIGGWTLSDPFHPLSGNPTYRKRFVDSAMEFLKTYTVFDGLDIDWEYPGGGGANEALGDKEEGKSYALLMAELRAALNTLEKETGRTYQLTSAVGSDPDKIKVVSYTEAALHMDYVFAMTYDFYGAWNGTLGHHAGLFAGKDESIQDFNGSAAIENLIAKGVPANKLVLGFAMYGRGWNEVKPTGTNPLAGIGGQAIAGTWEDGVLDYRNIATRFFDEKAIKGKAGFQYYYDEYSEAPYLWNASSREFVTFDDARSVKAKALFAKRKGLAGMFSWEIDADNGTLLESAESGLKDSL